MAKQQIKRPVVTIKCPEIKVIGFQRELQVEEDTKKENIQCVHDFQEVEDPTYTYINNDTHTKIIKYKCDLCGEEYIETVTEQCEYEEVSE